MGLVPEGDVGSLLNAVLRVVMVAVRERGRSFLGGSIAHIYRGLVSRILEAPSVHLGLSGLTKQTDPGPVIGSMLSGTLSTAPSPPWAIAGNHVRQP